MRILNCKAILSLLIVGFSYSSQAAQLPGFVAEFQEKEFTKTIKEDFSITSDGLVKLNNKFGKINVKTWNENRVAITVDISVHANSEAEAQKTFDRIAINFSNTASEVTATTKIESQGGNWSWWRVNKSSSFDINYEVMMPASANLSLSMAHGNAYAEAITGSAKIDVKHGNFRLDGVAGPLEVQLAHGDGTVNRAADAQLNIRHSKLLIKEAGKIELEARHSSIDIDKALDIQANSSHNHFDLGTIQGLTNEGQHDNIDLKSASNLQIKARYSDLVIGHLEKKGTFELGFGGATIQLLSKDFSLIKFNGHHSDLKVQIEEGGQYQLDIEGTHAHFAYPDEVTVTVEKDKHFKQELKGHTGTAASGGSIQAKIEHGSAKIRHYKETAH